MGKFSTTSTFVEIVTNDKVKSAANALLTAVAFEGLVEVEFKFDARDQEFKILDVNPRAWSWLALCEPAGADFAPERPVPFYFFRHGRFHRQLLTADPARQS